GVAAVERGAGGMGGKLHVLAQQLVERRAQCRRLGARRGLDCDVRDRGRALIAGDGDSAGRRDGRDGEGECADTGNGNHDLPPLDPWSNCGPAARPLNVDPAPSERFVQADGELADFLCAAAVSPCRGSYAGDTVTDARSGTVSWGARGRSRECYQRPGLPSPTVRRGSREPGEPVQWPPICSCP